MPFRQLLKCLYQYFENRNGIFRDLKLNLRWEQWSNILIWQLFENLPKIKYFLAYVNRSISPTIKIILSDFCYCPTNLRNDWYQVYLAWVGFELRLVVVIGTDIISSYKSNYHMITTTTAPILFLCYQD